MVDQYAENAGVRLRFVREGAGSKNVVLLHGVGSRLDSFDFLVPALTDRFTVVRYDLRGHGESDKPPGPYALVDFVDDLRAVMDANDMSSASVVGNSFGGMIGQAFACAHPERTDKLVVISAVAGRTATERQQLVERAEALARGGAQRTVGDALGRWYTPEFRNAHPEMIETASSNVLLNDPAGYAAAYRVFAENDVVDRLGQITCPTYVITGEHDRGSSPRMAYLMRERIPNAHVCVIPRLRHALMVEAPELVTALVVNFLIE
jgi:pimeloyl-ACP methyl ester carboxylesterase